MLRIYTFSILMILLSGCIPLKTSQQSQSEPSFIPSRNLKTLLLNRQTLCDAPADQIDAQLDQLTRTPTHAEDFHEDRLDALLLASCQPARTPGLLKQLLAEHQNQPGWPSDYLALFDLLNAQVKAYATLDALYQDLKISHQDLIVTHQKRVEEHQALIKDLGKIETDLQQKSNP
jgi:hypothetical protein